MRVFLERCGNRRWKCGSALALRTAFACPTAASRWRVWRMGKRPVASSGDDH